MKRTIMIAVLGVAALASQAVTAAPRPVTFVVSRTGHFVQRAANTIDRHLIRPTDRHVIEPARRTIVNHTPPWR